MDNLSEIENNKAQILELLNKRDSARTQMWENKSDIKKISTIRNKIFFNGKLMERKINFSEYYSYQGKSFIDKLYKSIAQYKSDIILVEI